MKIKRVLALLLLSLGVSLPTAVVAMKNDKSKIEEPKIEDDQKDQGGDVSPTTPRGQGTQPLNQNAQDGDRVVINFTNTSHDGTIPHATQKNHHLVFTIGKGTQLKVIGKSIIGMKTGETKTILIGSDLVYIELLAIVQTPKSI